jgi:hypothetical protein
MLPASIQYTIVDGQSQVAAEATLQLAGMGPGLYVVQATVPCVAR